MAAEARGSLPWMVPEETKPSPEREHTDASLRAEREKTDRALAERQTAVDAVREDADTVVERARENADAVLLATRHEADGADPRAEAAQPLPELVEARVREDDALRAERDAADESLRRERAENTRVLAVLLPIERDKTDRYLLTERARSDEAVAHRDDFLGIVAHDLRNLLGGIVMSAGVLADSAAEGNAGEETILGTKRIQRYSARMNRLIGDLVDVASIEAGKLSLTPERGDPSALIVEAVDMFKGSASAKGVTLEAVPMAPLEVEIDHDRMIQVLANLITNAIKFTAAGGTISVGGDHTEADVRFFVRDNGSGIPETMLEAIFERFWQVGKNDKRGVGLGLYISRCIVEAHGGTIHAESKLGEGSTLVFVIPRRFRASA